MKTTPIPSSWVDRGDILLQNAAGWTVRVPTPELYALWEEARAADNETAKWCGFDWQRDHLAGAMRLAVDSGLIDTCRRVDGRVMCERPLRPGDTACPNHEVTA